VRASDMMHD